MFIDCFAYRIQFRIPAIPKQDSVFQIVVANLEFTIFGKHLTIRSAERSVKKIKNFMELDLWIMS